MDPRRPKQLKAAAAASLAARPGHWKLALFFSGALALVMLISLGLDLYLDALVSQTGGLAGIDRRNTLQTVQTVLAYAVDLLQPFWTMGFVALALKLSRKEAVSADTLLDGFRRFGPVLRYQLLAGILSVTLMIVPLYGVSVFLMMTPLAIPVMNMLTPYITADGGLDLTAMDDAAYQALMEACMPMIVVILIVGALLYLVISYFFRMGPYAIMDEPHRGAFWAIFQSVRIMGRNIFHLIRLDLSFWWYYLAQTVTALVCMSWSLLAQFGIVLPVDPTVGQLVTYLVGMAGTVGVYALWGNYAEVTYATAYQVYRDYQPAPKPVSQNVPWNY